jgi:hypothetical protein
MIFADPYQKLKETLEGKTVSQVEEELENKGEEDQVGCLTTGCLYTIKLLFFSMISALYIFIIEPAITIFAMVEGIGNPYISYGILVIILLEWIYSVATFSQALEIYDARKEDSEENDEEEIHFSPSIKTRIRVFLFKLPEIYLWYIFILLITQ